MAATARCAGGGRRVDERQPTGGRRSPVMSMPGLRRPVIHASGTRWWVREPWRPSHGDLSLRDRRERDGGVADTAVVPRSLRSPAVHATGGAAVGHHLAEAR